MAARSSDIPGVDAPVPGDVDLAVFAAGPWIGHRDPLTALHHAFAAGIDDGLTLNYAAQRPVAAAGILEVYYLRGYVVGVKDWVELNPDIPDPGHGTVARNPRGPRDYHSSPPGVAAILPLPEPLEARPILHATVELAAFHAFSLPDVPLPTGVGRHSLAASWPVNLRQRLFSATLIGCWVIPEGRRAAPVLTSFLAEVLRVLFAYLWPLEEPPTIVEPPSEEPLAQVGAVFVCGTDSQIHQLIRGRLWSTTLMCFIVYPNVDTSTTFVCTFESMRFARSDAEAVHESVLAALTGSITASNFCLDRGREPAEVFSTLRLEYVSVPVSGGGGRRLWNVDMDLGFGGPAGLQAWRWIISALRPVDDDGRWMTSVDLQCDVCDCVRHPSELCPTRAYPEWLGAVRVSLE